MVGTKTKQSWRIRRRVAGIVTGVWFNFANTACCTMLSTFGQLDWQKFFFNCASPLPATMMIAIAKHKPLHASISPLLLHNFLVSIFHLLTSHIYIGEEERTQCYTKPLVSIELWPRKIQLICLLETPVFRTNSKIVRNTCKLTQTHGIFKINAYSRHVPSYQVSST